MDYADLKSGNGGALNGGNGGGEEPDAPEGSLVSVESITDGYTATAGFGTYAGNSGVCAQINGAGGEVTDANATVTIDGENANYIPGVGWYVAADAAPDGGVAIVVTPIVNGEGA